jgi:hypothetical protein
MSSGGEESRVRRLSLYVSTVALVMSVCSFSLAIVAYMQTTKPHTAFVDTCTKLDLLEKRISQAESYIQLWTENGCDPGADLVACEGNLAQARSLRDQAQSSLMRYQYEQANDYILQADELVASVPAYHPPAAEGGLRAFVWVIIAIGVVGGVAVVLFLYARSRKPNSPGG